MATEAVLRLTIYFRNRVRTAINVWGDCVGTAVVEKLSQKELEKLMENNIDICLEEIQVDKLKHTDV